MRASFSSPAIRDPGQLLALILSRAKETLSAKGVYFEVADEHTTEEGVILVVGVPSDKDEGDEEGLGGD